MADENIQGFGWLWNVGALQQLCDSIRKVNVHVVQHDADGMEYIDVDCGVKKLRLLKRHMYDEFWALVDELNRRSERSSRNGKFETGLDLPRFVNELCGWYLSRNYLVCSKHGTGKTGLVIATLIKRTVFNETTVVQVDPRRAFVISNYQVREIDVSMQEEDWTKDNDDIYGTALPQWTTRRNIWVLFDTTVPSRKLMCFHWVQIQFKCPSNSRRIQTMYFEKNCSPMSIHIGLWRAKEVKFIAKAIYKLTPQEQQRCLKLFLEYDPTAVLALNRRFVVSDQCSDHLAKMRRTLPYETMRVISSGENCQRVLQDSTQAQSPCPILIQRPNKDVKLAHVGVSESIYMSTPRVALMLVQSAFDCKQSFRLLSWYRDLETQKTTEPRHAILYAMLKNKLQSGGKFTIKVDTLSEPPQRIRIISRLREFIIRPCRYELEDNAPFHLDVMSCGSAGKRGRYDRFYAPSCCDPNRQLGVAVITEPSGPRLYVFRFIVSVHQSNKFNIYDYSEQLNEIWDQMPPEVKRKTPYFLSVGVDLEPAYERDRAFISPQGSTPSLNDQLKVPADNIPVPKTLSTTSNDSESEQICEEKVCDVFTTGFVILEQRDLIHASFTLGMRARLFIKKCYRKMRYFN